MSDEKPPQPATNPVVPTPEMENRPSLSVVEKDGKVVPKRLARPTSKRELPIVRVDHDLDIVNDEATYYLAKHPNIYQRNKKLVDILDGEIREIKPSTLIEKLTNQMTFMGLPSKLKVGDDPDKMRIRAKLPSQHIVNGIFTRGNWGARELVGVTDTPLVRRNGSVLQTPGYDSESRYVYQPTMEFPQITENPSRDECHQLMNDVLAPISSFPWKTINNKSASLSAYLSMLLTLMLVPAIDGPIPGFLITANIRGTGKTKLASIASVVATGRPADTEAFPDNDEEVRKKITTTLQSAQRIAVFDNVTRKISGDAVDIVLTSRRYKDRKLGSNTDTILLANNTLWCWTGNNIEANGDTVRRLIPIELVSYDLQPEEKRFPFDPVADALAHRAEIVTALLTMIRGWYHAGCPRSDITIGSYEAWSGIVPQILVWLGITNPLDARKTSRAVKDVALVQASALGDIWHKVEGLLRADNGITTTQFLRALYPEKGEAIFQHVVEIRNQLEGLLEVAGRQDVHKALSYRLRSVRGRVLDADGRSLDSEGMSAGSPRWSVRVRARET